MLPYQLAAVDLDDTLLGPDKQIGAANARAIAELQNAGVQVVLASGRRHENMLRFHQQLGLSGPIVSCNGALAKNAETGEVLWEKRVPADLAQEIVTEGDRIGVTQNYYHANGGLYVREANGWTELYQSRTGSLVTVEGDLHHFDGTSPYKIIWIDAPETISGLFAALAPRYENRLYVTTTDPEYLEWMAVGVNKAVGVKAVADSLRIEQSAVLAFGDGNNDVPMLQWAGLGISMNHARPAAKAAAKWSAPPGDPETAFARAVDKLLALHA